MREAILFLVLSAPGHLTYANPANIDYFTAPTQNQCSPLAHGFVHFSSGATLCVDQTPEQIKEQMKQ